MAMSYKSSEELRQEWASSDDPQLRSSLLDEMEVACLEEGLMAYEGVPFPGDLSGGGAGKNKELEKLNKSTSHLALCIAYGGTKAAGAQRELTDKEKTSGLTDSGIPNCTVGGERYRKLTPKELADNVLWVNRNYSVSEIAAAKDKLQVLQLEHDALKEDRDEEKHAEVIDNIQEVKDLIMNPLKGMLLNEKGVKRKHSELEALIVSRRKQEDLLLKKIKDEENEQLKQQLQTERREHDLKVKQIQAEAQKAKADESAAKEVAKKAEAESRKAEAEAKSAVAAKNEAEALLKKQEIVEKMQQKKDEASAKKEAKKQEACEKAREKAREKKAAKLAKKKNEKERKSKKDKAVDEKSDDENFRQRHDFEEEESSYTEDGA